MIRLAVLITEDTIPFIAKLNDGVEPAEDVANSTHYFVTPAENINDHHNYIMLSEVFFKMFPKASREEKFQILK